MRSSIEKSMFEQTYLVGKYYQGNFQNRLDLFYFCYVIVGHAQSWIEREKGVFGPGLLDDRNSGGMMPPPPSCLVHSATPPHILHPSNPPAKRRRVFHRPTPTPTPTPPKNWFSFPLPPLPWMLEGRLLLLRKLCGISATQSVYSSIYTQTTE